MSGDLLCISHLRWGFVYQRPNHLMARWARERRVYFVEEPVYDEPEPRMEVRTVAEDLHVAVPHLPVGLTAAEDEALRKVLTDQLVVNTRLRDPLLWMYSPMGWPQVKHVKASAVVYDCMDELAHFRGAPPKLAERERAVFARADLVFTGGQSLYEAKRTQHPHVHAFPSSVDARHFERARRRGLDPRDQKDIPHPRVGFFGVVDERMNLELVAEVANLRPNLHFIFVGPVVKIEPGVLPQAPNIHWLGGKTYEELPDYVAGWDVAMMPFALNDSTRFISPTKTLEYLAAHRPIVSTSIRDVVEPYGEQNLVRIADTPFAFAAAIDAALDERGTQREEAWKQAAEECLANTSWDRTWSRMCAHVDEVLMRRARGATGRESREETMPCSTI